MVVTLYYYEIDIIKDTFTWIIFYAKTQGHSAHFQIKLIT